MAYLEKEEALSVLKLAQEGGYLDSLPEEDKYIELAEFYIAEAEKESKSNSKMKKDPTIKQILSLKSYALINKSEKAFLQYSGEDVKLEYNLPIPPDIEREPTPFPVDFTVLTEKELRRLHGEYNSYLGRAKWLLATSANRLANAVYLREDEYRKAFKDSHNKLTLVGEKPTRDLLDSLAKTTEEYKKYDLDAKNEQEKVTIYKALAEIYGGNVDRLSREATMRADEGRRY
jgi:hypothetical protein